MEPATSARHRRITYTLAVLWATLVCLSFVAFGAYDYSAAPVPAANTRLWPAGSLLPRDSALPTLVVAVHPKCPCSRATLRELAEIAALTRRPYSTKLLIYRPEHSDPGWAHSTLTTAAANLPGIELIDDPGARVAAQFGALTSGEVLLFQPSGSLQFRGGITPWRGHSGPNYGVDSIVALLNGRFAQRHSTPVFGCSLSTPGPLASSGNSQ